METSLATYALGLVVKILGGSLWNMTVGSLDSGRLVVLPVM